MNIDNKPTVTPLRQQYMELKAKHTDAILFFQLGDFYETFDSDAETAARELDLVLTNRPISRSERIPMAGVPVHAIDQYARQLQVKGFRVAIAEQVTDSYTGAGVIERCVTKVLLPVTNTLWVKLRGTKAFAPMVIASMEECRKHFAQYDETTLDYWKIVRDSDGVTLAERWFTGENAGRWAADRRAQLAAGAPSALILHADGSQELVKPANGTDFTLKECQSIVGGSVELVPLEDGRAMIIHQEGKLLDLQVNLAATELFLAGRDGYDEIVGDVLICRNDQFR